MSRDESVVSVLSLAVYIDRYMPDVARRYGVKQQASYSTHGQDFPVAILRPEDAPLVSDVATIDGFGAGSAGRLHARVYEHLRDYEGLILECLGRGHAVILATVQSDGRVGFSASGVASESSHGHCLRDAIPPLSVDAQTGTARIPLNSR